MIISSPGSFRLASLPVVWVIILVATNASCLAQSPKASDESGPAGEIEPADDLDASFREEISEYSIALDGQAATPLELRETPVLSWTNPVQQDQHGAIFVWMASGRPQAVGCCFQFGTGNAKARVQEFHTLAAEPLSARRDEKVVWQPRQGLTFSPLPSPAPAASPQARAIQMRQISRRFTAQMIRESGDRTELRLISRPVLSYAPNNERCTDGAIFSFAAGGTDPDAFLIIENVSVEGQPTWQYCFARFHFNELKAQLDGNDVWSAEAKPGLSRNYLGSKKFRDDTYISFRTH